MWAAKKSAVDPAVGGLLGDRLGAVLAELEPGRSCGSGQAQPGQSNPSGWLIRSSVRDRFGNGRLGTKHRATEAMTPASPLPSAWGR